MSVTILRRIQDKFHPGEWLTVKQKEQFAWFVLRPTFRKQNKMYTGGISCKSDSLCSVAEFRSVSTAAAAAAPSSTADKKGRRTKSSVYIKRRFLSNANIASLHLIRNLSLSLPLFSLNLKRTSSIRNWRRGERKNFGTQPPQRLDMYTLAPRESIICARLSLE